MLETNKQKITFETHDFLILLMHSPIVPCLSCVWKYYVSATIHIFSTPTYVKLGSLKRPMREYQHPKNGQELQSSIQFIVLFSRCKKVMENILYDTSVAVILWLDIKTFKAIFLQYWEPSKIFSKQVRSIINKLLNF